MDDSHLKVACALVRQRQRQVHEGVKLDGVELAIFHGTDQRRLVQTLEHTAGC